jgi:hypothetical protein
LGYYGNSSLVLSTRRESAHPIGIEYLLILSELF